MTTPSPTSPRFGLPLTATLVLTVTTILGLLSAAWLGFWALMHSDPPECFIANEENAEKGQVLCEAAKATHDMTTSYIVGAMAVLPLLVIIAMLWFRRRAAARWGALLGIVAILVVGTLAAWNLAP